MKDRYITAFIDKGNKLTFNVLGEEFVEWIYTDDQKEYCYDLFKRFRYFGVDADGNEGIIPVVIHNNITGVTTKLFGDIEFTDRYLGIPKGVKYIPNKLITYERDRLEWVYDRIKRIFKQFDDDNLTNQEYCSEMRNLLNERLK